MFTRLLFTTLISREIPTRTVFFFFFDELYFYIFFTELFNLILILIYFKLFYHIFNKRNSKIPISTFLYLNDFEETFNVDKKKCRHSSLSKFTIESWCCNKI